MLTEKPRKQTQFRIPADKLDLIDRVARMEGRSRTDLVVEAATRYAEEVLLDKTDFPWPAGDFAAFEAALAAPAAPSDYVRKARRKPRVWES